MEHHEELFRIFVEKKSCSKAVLQHYGKGYGIEEATLDAIASALEAGLGIGASCGVLVAAFIVVGLRSGAARDNVSDSVTFDVQDIAKSMAIKFTEEFGSTLCRELTDFDMASPNTRHFNMSIDEHMRHRFRVCGKYVSFVAAMLDETVVNVR